MGHFTPLAIDKSEARTFHELREKALSAIDLLLTPLENLCSSLARSALPSDPTVRELELCGHVATIWWKIHSSLNTATKEEREKVPFEPLNLSGHGTQNKYSSQVNSLELQ